MAELSHARWHRNRAEKGEKVGGGFFVFRRGSTTGRIKINPAKLPFEHPSLEAALREAKRLTERHPGVGFSVLKEIVFYKNKGTLEDPV